MKKLKKKQRTKAIRTKKGIFRPMAKKDYEDEKWEIGAKENAL